MPNPSHLSSARLGVLWVGQSTKQFAKYGCHVKSEIQPLVIEEFVLSQADSHDVFIFSLLKRM